MNERYRALCIAVLLLLGLASGQLASAQTTCDAWQPGSGAPGPDRPFDDFQVFDDGSGPALYACGRFRSIGGMRAEGVVRWDGTRWRQVGRGIVDVSSLEVFDDGSGPRLVAGGSFRTSIGSVADLVATWDGHQWSALPGLMPTAFSAWITGLVAFDDGGGPALYAATLGSATTRLARWRAGAWTDASAGISTATSQALPWGAYVLSFAAFDAGSGPQLYAGLSSIESVLVRWDGTRWVDASPGLANGHAFALTTFGRSLYMATASMGQSTASLVRYDGSTLAPVVPALDPLSGTATVLGLGEHRFGTSSMLVVAGIFRGAGGVDSPGVVAFDGAGWHAVGPLRGVSWSGGWVALASYDDGSGPALFAGGMARSFAGTSAMGGARLQNGAWVAFARGQGLRAAGLVNAGERTRIGEFEFGGSRQLVAVGQGFQTPDATSWVAVLEDDGWRPLRGSTAPVDPLFAVTAHDFGAGPQLVAAGFLQSVGSSVVRWNGADWVAVGNLGGWQVRALASLSTASGPRLFAGAEHGLWSWDGNAWTSALAGQIQVNRVDSLVVHDDGTGPALYVSGDINVQGPSGWRRGVGRWNGSQWEPVGFTSLLNVSGPNVEMASVDLETGPSLHLSGSVNTTSGGAQLARWDGSTWTPIPTPYIVRGAVSFHDGVARRLVISARADTPPYTQVLKRVGDTWASLGAVDGFASGLAAHDSNGDGVDELFVAGSFRSVDEVPSLNVASYTPCGTRGEVVCAGDGTGSPCPCGNSGMSGRGCASSTFAIGAAISSRGISSITNDSLELDADALTGSFALVAQGTAVAGGGGVPFQDGLLCTGGIVTRLGSAPIASGSASFPQPGGPRLSQLGLVTMPGETRVYQAIYRNQASFCTSGAANATNGLQVTWSL